MPAGFVHQHNALRSWRDGLSEFSKEEVHCGGIEPGHHHGDTGVACRAYGADDPSRPVADIAQPARGIAALPFLDRRFASVCTPGPGQPGLPTRLVAGLFILKHMHNLSDEVLCARWLENPYYQFFCGELSFCHRLSWTPKMRQAAMVEPCP
jgi:hypothetical protein